jgi:hypothetical protein
MCFVFYSAGGGTALFLAGNQRNAHPVTKQGNPATLYALKTAIQQHSMHLK